MDNTTFSIQHTSFQFLSVCHYITSFGLFFHNQKLIPLENRNHSVSVLNTFFDYVHNSEDESSTKLELLRKVLVGSDLYGGGDDETLDMKYVNETYQYIISTALFSQYENIDCYLAGIVSRAKNITYLALKETVYEHLSKMYISRDYCSSRYESIELSSLTREKVFNDYLWSIFPEPEETMEIMDLNYIYAMIGLKIGRSVLSDWRDLTFDSYILLYRGIELDILDKDYYHYGLELFTTPALLFYAYNNKERFHVPYVSSLTRSETFWQEVYSNLFTFLKTSLMQSLRQNYQNSLHHKLETEMNLIQNRTFIAGTLIKLVCRYPRIEDIPSWYVSLYKTSQLFANLFRPRKCWEYLPNLEERFDRQFESVERTFFEIEQNSLLQVLRDSRLIEKLNLNVIVKIAMVPTYPMRCSMCSPTSRKRNSDIYLIFAIIEEGRKDFYAFRQENNTFSLLRSNGNEPEFARAIANDSSLRMEVPIFARVLKNRGEDYSVFIRNVATIETKEFIEALKKHYRDPTGAEKVIDFLKSLVPFYTCIENVKSGHRGGVAISCSLDIVSLLPIAGVGVKYSSLVWRSLVSEIGTQTLRRVSQSTFSKLAISVSLDEIYKTVARTLVEEVLTKRLVKDVTIASLRTFDPGFELSFQFFKFSKNILGRMIKNLPLNLPKVKNLLSSIESTLEANGNLMFVADNNGLIPSTLYKTDDYKIIRYLYPNSLDYFGPKCVAAFGITAELRTIEGNWFQVPVVPVEASKGTTYREFNPKSGRIYDNELLVGKDGLLRKRENYVNLPELNENGVLVDFYKTEDKLELKNGVLYCKRRLRRTGRTNLNENVNSEECIPFPVDPDIPGTSRESVPGTSRGSYIHKQDVVRTKNLLTTFQEKGLKGLKDDNNLLALRKIVNSLDSYQTLEKVSKPPADLWFTETLARPSIVEFLKNLKGEDFYFNDLTLLSANDPAEIIPKKKIRYTLRTEVRYHIKMNSHYGIVDLGEIDKTLENYIVFPDVVYFVTNTEYFNGKEILVIHLEQRQMSREDWIKIGERNNKLLDDEVQTKRGDLIQNAALYVSGNKPLNKFQRTEEKLRKYILKIDDTVNNVPTYDTVAKHIYSDNIIPLQYNEWKVTDNKFTADILFHSELHRVTDLKTAKNTINHVFHGIYVQPVEPVFETYKKYPKIGDLVRFEDYYTIYSFLSFNLVSDINTAARVAASVRRLALRQCDKALNKNPITMYFAHNLSRNKFEELIRMRTGGDYQFRQMQQFHWSREFTLNSFPRELQMNTFVMYEVTLSNRAGMADLTSIIYDPNIHYYVPEELTLKIVSRSKETIQGREVFVVKLEDDRVPTEKRMVNLVNKIDSVLSKRNNFYVNM